MSHCPKQRPSIRASSSLIPGNVSKPDVWIYFGLNLHGKHLVGSLAWDGIFQRYLPRWGWRDVGGETKCGQIGVTVKRNTREGDERENVENEGQEVKNSSVPAVNTKK